MTDRIERIETPAAMAARAVPFDAILMAILLEQQKELDRLRWRVEGPGNHAA